MGRIVAALVLLAMAFGGAVRADDAPSGVTTKDVAAIRELISRQIAAFGRDDGDAAFDMATKGIHQVFGNAANFMAMVRQGYGAVYRPREVEFRQLLTERGQYVQTVLVVGPDGIAMLAFYPMERQADGTWLIDGCWMIPAPDAAT